MQQPATAFFICSQCNAAYDSDTSLRNHKFSAHRWSGSDQRVPEHGGMPGESSEAQPSEHQAPPDHEIRGPDLW
jgi:hypothetical protein